MARINMDFIHLHNSLFFQGKDYTNKPKTKYPALTLVYDTELDCAILNHLSKIALIPASNIASMTVVDPSELGLELDAPVMLPPAQARAQREAETPTLTESIMALGDPSDPYDPNDPDDIAAHRAKVRAASAMANYVPPKVAQNDALIQDARNAAAGARSPQVSHPAKPKDGVTGRPKPMDRAALMAQLNAEEKVPRV